MKQKIVSNIIWRFLERAGAKTVEFIVTVILARILGPDAYGDVALITAFTVILQVFVDGGLGNALIQKKDADETDFASVFYFNILFCIVIYILLFWISPFIAAFYGKPALKNMIRAAGITVIISGIKNVQQALISRKLQFRKFFFATLVGTLLSAVVGIAMALAGCGTWSLIAQLLINAAIDTAVVWFINRWKPEKVFSAERLKQLLSYGWKLLASNLIDAIYANIRQLVIGKLYSSSDLAYYNRGRSMPNVIVNNINTSIDSVLFPVIASEQNNRKEVKKITRQAIMTSNYLMAPLMMGMAFAADSLIRVLLTEAWLPCVPYLRVFCIIYMLQPVHTANTNAVKAMGRSDLLLKIEIIKKTIGITILILCMRHGMPAILYGYLANNFIDQMINSWPNRKLLNYKYHEQIKDLLPSTMLAVFMGVCVFFVSGFHFEAGITLTVQIGLGFFIYLSGSVIFRLEAYRQVLNILKTYLKKEKITNLKMRDKEAQK